MINICGLKINLSVSYPVCKEIKLSLFCANKLFSKKALSDQLGLDTLFVKNWI